MSKLTDQLWADIRDELDGLKKELRLQRAFAVDETAAGVRVILPGATAAGIERIPRLNDGMDIAPGAEVIIGNIGGGRVILGAVHDANLDATSHESMISYVASRGEQLVTNYTGALRSDYNFPGLSFDPTDAVAGFGSFRSDGRATIRSAEIVPVDPNLNYQMDLYVRGDNAAMRFYAGVLAVDSNGEDISAWHYVRNTAADTTLAAALEPGDTTFRLTSVANWQNAGADHQRTLVVYPYVDPNGRVYDPYTYSRLTILPAWAAGGINTSTRVVTLINPWPESMGSHPAGTKVGNAMSAGSAAYIAASNVLTPTVWTKFTGTIGGINNTAGYIIDKFPPGTAGLRVYLLPDYNSAGGKTWFSAISFRQV